MRGKFFGPAGRLIVMTGLLCATALPARGETSYRERIKRFDISGHVNSRRDIWNAIRDWGPSSGGRLIVGTARPRFSYKYKIQRRGNRCTATDIKVAVMVTLRLPEWHFKDTAKPDLQRYFGCILRTVTVHEKRHGEIAYETGQEIERRMLSRLRGTSCSAITAKAQNIFQTAIAEGSVRQTDFDRRDYARKRYEKCNTGTGPAVSLSSTPFKRSFASSRVPTKRFDAADDSPTQAATGTPAVAPPAPTGNRAAPAPAPSGSPFVSLEGAQRLLGSAGIVLAIALGVLGLFVVFITAAARFEKKRELMGAEFAGDAGEVADEVSEPAEPVVGAPPRPAAKPVARRPARQGFGKRGVKG